MKEKDLLQLRKSSSCGKNFSSWKSACRMDFSSKEESFFSFSKRRVKKAIIAYAKSQTSQVKDRGVFIDSIVTEGSVRTVYFACGSALSAKRQRLLFLRTLGLAMKYKAYPEMRCCMVFPMKNEYVKQWKLTPEWLKKTGLMCMFLDKKMLKNLDFLS